MKGKKGISFLIFLFLLLLDQLIKFFTFRHIPLMSWADSHYPYGGIGIFHNWSGVSFSLNYVQNLGAAWGLFAAYSEWLFYIRCGVVALLFFYFLGKNHSLFKGVALLAILTGAMGNVMDFFLYGHVIDMFHFTFGNYTFPIFNIADTLITLGIFSLFFLSFQDKKQIA